MNVVVRRQPNLQSRRALPEGDAVYYGRSNILTALANKKGDNLVNHFEN